MRSEFSYFYFGYSELSMANILKVSSLLVQRLWFKTNLKLCKIWFDMGEYGRMSKVSCLNSSVSFLSAV